MKTVITRFLFTMLPITYMALIWMQTRYFDPNSIDHLFRNINLPVILVVGIGFELAHLFEFGLLYFMIVAAFASFGLLNRIKEVLALIIALLYGITDEIHQLFVPFRSFSSIDLLKNSIGVFWCWLIVHRGYFIKKDTKFAGLLRKITEISSTA